MSLVEVSYSHATGHRASDFSAANSVLTRRFTEAKSERRVAPPRRHIYGDAPTPMWGVLLELGVAGPTNETLYFG